MCRKKRVNVNLLPFMLTNERVLRDLPAQARPVSSLKKDSYSYLHIYTETRISTRGAQKGRATLRGLAESRQS